MAPNVSVAAVNLQSYSNLQSQNWTESYSNLQSRSSKENNQSQFCLSKNDSIQIH